MLLYNSAEFPNGGPTSWTDFWDVQKFPGPRAMPNDGNAQAPIAAALMADGVPMDQIIPFDFDRAFAKLDQIRDHVAVWWTSGDQAQQTIRDGEVVMSMMLSGRAQSLKKEGQPVELTWQGAVDDGALWGLMKGTPNRKEALEFLNFWMTRPEAHVEFMKQINYYTANAEAIGMLTGVDLENAQASISDKVFKISATDWVAENDDDISQRWDSWFVA